MVNNFELIRDNMNFLNERSFYFIQIIKRKKENPELTGYSQPIESFYIFDKEQFERVMPHIIDKCEQNRARAYVKMNCLDAQNVGLKAIAVLSQELTEGNWKRLGSAFNCACGQSGKQDGNEKLYIVDIDSKDMNYLEKIKYTINNICAPYDNNDKVKMVVPTKNGYHFITTGFDLKLFKQNYSDIDVHKEGITLLYFPKCCD